MRACAWSLKAEIKLVEPKGVVLLGVTDGKAIYGSGLPGR